jgi:hypothetical protein
LHNYCKQDSLTSEVCKSLKQHVLEANLRFEKELIDFQAEKLAKQIVDKLKQRTDIVN